MISYTIAILFIVNIFLSIVSDYRTAILYLTFFAAGFAVTWLLNTNEYRKYSVKIYTISFTAGTIFILMCKIYMDHHSYDYLLVWDTIFSFLPDTQNYISMNDIRIALYTEWYGYELLEKTSRSSGPGYYSILILFGYLSDSINSDLFLTLQLSTLFFSSFIGVVIFRLMDLNGIALDRSFIYTLFITLCSIVFYYSTLVLRDSHVALLYLLAVFITFKKNFSIIHIILLSTLSLITILFRLESGLFLFIMIPLYLFFNLKMTNKKKYLIIIPIVIGVLFSFIAGIYFHNVYEVYEKTTNTYIESDKGDGLIGILNSIPLVGRFFAIIYNALLPIPFWSRLGLGSNIIQPEWDNVMNFPQSFSSILNWIVLIIIGTFALSKSIRKRVKENISKKLILHLLIGILFLYMQATVIAKRRVMMYYCIFYIFAFLITECLTIREKRINLIIIIIGFILLQFIGIFYLSG